MIAGLVLAGGRSSRMGGRDKALASLGGTTLLARAIDRLAPQVVALAISSNADIGERSRGLPVLADRHGGFQGPLAGIHAGLAWAAGLQGVSHLATVSVDAPFTPNDLVERLLGEAQQCRAPIVLARSADLDHPTCALWSIQALAPLERLLRDDASRRMMDFVTATGSTAVEFDVEGIDPFFNVNTPQDLAQAETWLERWR